MIDYWGFNIFLTRSTSTALRSSPSWSSNILKIFYLKSIVQLTKMVFFFGKLAFAISLWRLTWQLQSKTGWNRFHFTNSENSGELVLKMLFSLKKKTNGVFVMLQNRKNELLKTERNQVFLKNVFFDFEEQKYILKIANLTSVKIQTKKYWRVSE